MLDVANHPNRNKHRQPGPSAAEVRAARDKLELTQEQCAELAGYGAQQRWDEIEAGTRTMDPWRWKYFLHRAGIERLPWKAADTK